MGRAKALSILCGRLHFTEYHIACARADSPDALRSWLCACTGLNLRRHLPDSRDVFMADTSGLRNRAFAFGFVSTLFICTAFAGSLAAQSFVKTSGWRWGYGAFAITIISLFVPLAVVFKYYQSAKAAKLSPPSNGSPAAVQRLQSITHYFHEFDSKFNCGGS